ncbi:hypothetical protein Tco_0850942 [Tanacetum coccineum]
MSLFKVPSKVLQNLESIRRHFFNGHDLGSNKATWVKRNNVLIDKKRGGLGVSSLYALNRGLMLKWVWKFLSQKDSLWTKVIVAIHGVGGKIHSEWTSTGKSCWLSILSEVRSLQRKGMYVFDYLTHKMGNGESTKFPVDHWPAGGVLKGYFPRCLRLKLQGGFFRSNLVELVRSVTLVPMADRWIFEGWRNGREIRRPLARRDKSMSSVSRIWGGASLATWNLALTPDLIVNDVHFDMALTVAEYISRIEGDPTTKFKTLLPVVACYAYGSEIKDPR